MITSLNIQYRSIDDLIASKEKITDYSPENILIQVFSGVLKECVIKQLLSDIREVFPGVSVIGASTAGEIMDGEYLEQSILVNITFFKHTKVRSALISQNDDLELAGQKTGAAIDQKDVKAVIVFGSGTKDGKFINVREFLTSLRSKIPNGIIAGAQASENFERNATFVFTEKGITKNGFAAASLSGENLRVNNAYNSSLVPIGKKMIVTKVKGNRLYTIDERTVRDIYSHYLGDDMSIDIQQLSMDFPLVIERGGLFITNIATEVHDDGSFTYMEKMHAGEKLRFGFCHIGLLSSGADKFRSTLHQFNPQAIFIYSCFARKCALGQDLSVELSSVKGISTSAGFFSYGEFYSDSDSKVHLFQQTMTSLSLSEADDQDLISGQVVDGSQVIDNTSRQFRTMRVLHHLVETSAKEIESMNQKLMALASKDALTGLANRRRFDEMLSKAIKQQGRSKETISLIMMDLDYFKQYNDTYGHVAGDDCLRAVAQVIKETVQRPSDTPARYGGEEFACVLPMTDSAGAIHIAEKIRIEIEKLHIPHSKSSAADHVTASLGVLTVNSSEVLLSPQQLVEACDGLLYQAKQQGRNQIAANTS